MTPDSRDHVLKVVLVGEDSAGYQALQVLESSAQDVVAVLTSRPGEVSGSGTLWKLAEKTGHPVWESNRVKEAEFAEWLSEHSVDILLNVHSLHIVNTDVLAAPRIGSFNLHPGPLPEYAGLNTVSWALYRGATEYGVTLHEMSPEIDSGRIVSKQLFDVGKEDNALSLYWKCLRAGTTMVAKLIENLASDPESLEMTEQDSSCRQYFRAGPPNDGWLSWHQTATRVLDFVRACDYQPYDSPWGHPRTRLGSQEISIVKTSRTGETCSERPGTVRASGTVPEVACIDEWLAVQTVEVTSERVSATGVLHPGSVLESSEGASTSD